MTYNELAKSGKFAGKRIPYAHLLRCDEWNSFRNKVLERDNRKCVKCNLDISKQQQDKKYGWIEFSIPRDTVICEMIYIHSQVKLGKMDESILEEYIRRTNHLKDNYQHSFRVLKDKRHLQAHHRYYVLDRLPWEYGLEAMDTLCNVCHEKLHEEVKVPILAKTGDIEEMHVIECNRCNGMGYFPQYRHVENGICFRCNGNKYEEFID